MRISDWSSDVCSSDLIVGADRVRVRFRRLDIANDPWATGDLAMPLAALPTDRSRRALLRGAASAVVVRPPGAVDEARFVERCTRCNACIVACSEHLLVRAEAGFPERDWQRGERSEEPTSELQSLMR